MSRTLRITIVDTPVEVHAIAMALRKYISRNTGAFVFDNCGVGSREEPRRLEVDFAERKYNNENFL